MWLNRRLRGQASLPDTLREYLDAAPGDEASTGSVSRKAPTARPRGPRKLVQERVIHEMRISDQLPRLDAMTEEEMKATFRASRDTCRKARQTILSKINNSDNLRQSPTIDK
jgi:hypothetical protein